MLYAYTMFSLLLYWFFDIEKETRYGIKKTIKNMIHAAIRMREAIPPQ
jgi:hypothetical protein